MKKWLWVSGGILLATVLFVWMLPSALFIIAMGNIGETTVVQSVTSPNGQYVAELIDVDQGALGGDTVIEVRKVKPFAKSKQLYTGPWGEFEYMTMYWKDDRCLIVKNEQKHSTEEYIVEPW